MFRVAQIQLPKLSEELFLEELSRSVGPRDRG